MGAPIGIFAKPRGNIPNPKTGRANLQIQPRTEQQLQELWYSFDKNGDGSVSKEDRARVNIRYC